MDLHYHKNQESLLKGVHETLAQNCGMLEVKIYVSQWKRVKKTHKNFVLYRMTMYA
jgi:hypothetical protein